MFSTLALAAALSLAPAQNPTLDLTNARVTFGGEFGPTRPNNQLLPGDVFFLAFDIDNLQPDPVGKVQYTMGMEVTDASGKSIYKQDPTNMEQTLPLGGSKLPARAYAIIGLDQAKGSYTCKVSVIDKVTNAGKVVEKSFEVGAAQFAAVGLFTSSDADGALPAPLGGVAGQPLWIHFAVVNFGRDAQTKQPNVVTEIRVVDQNKKPTTAQPLVYVTAKTKVDTDRHIPHSIPMPLNRAGVFVIEITTICKVSGKKYEMSFPITVTPSPR
jgi:hypothetical protein